MMKFVARKVSFKGNLNNYKSRITFSDRQVTTSLIVKSSIQLKEKASNIPSYLFGSTDTIPIHQNLVFNPDISPSHRKLLETIRQIPAKIEQLNETSKIGDEIYTVDSMTSSTPNGLYLCQINMEEEQYSEASQEYIQSTTDLIKMGKGTGLKYIQRVMLNWYGPLTQEIIQEIRMIEEKSPGKDRTHYGPCFLLLPPDKLSIITLNACLNSVLKCGNAGVSVMQLARYIGDLVELEVNILKMQKGKEYLKSWEKNLLNTVTKDIKKNYRKTVDIRINKLISLEDWPVPIKIKLGAALTSIALRTLYTDKGTPAYSHSVRFQNITQKRCGSVKLDDDLFHSITENHDLEFIRPRYLPMLIPPIDWDNRKKKSGCYLRLHSQLMRTTSISQKGALNVANITQLLESLNYLGGIPWSINNPVFAVVKEAWARGLEIGELPSKKNLTYPAKEACHRVPTNLYKKKIKDDAKVLSFAPAADLDMKSDVLGIDGEGDLPEHFIGPRNSPNYWNTPKFDSRYYDEMCRKVDMKNCELHSLRCDLQIKLWVADKFNINNNKFFYPYSLDFRGRAYPVPPNLNHLGSDLSRALLMFHETKPLGENGLFWLKVHLANLFGYNKVSLRQRAEWIDKQWSLIQDTAADPLDGKRWWATAEEPFQALATCLELIAATTYEGGSAAYPCRLPVHQDGSCNGLQHYAALGRDSVGAKAVNVVSADSPFPTAEAAEDWADEGPQDVYSRVLDIVLAKIEVDCTQELPPATADEIDVKPAVQALRNKQKYALLVRGLVNRKVIKQTVMTSVYGVTKSGASLQVLSRLQEQFGGGITDAERDRNLRDAARYVANLTLDSLGEMFGNARSIMDWLGTCALLVASQGQVMSWVTPMGLPVMQPYRKPSIHTIRTLLQSITLAANDESLPVYAQKQRSAFPPNFVHSLDATHMLLTSLKMKKRNLTFAAVHDSYWTHPCDVEQMGESLRDCFVELYDQPILEKLHESLTIRYPDVEFPPVPDRGDLCLSAVRKSRYFFH